MRRRILKASFMVILIGATISIFPFGYSSAVTNDTDFQVEVKEILSVSITTPTEWVSGNVGDLLNNTINLSIMTNNPDGFTAGMTTSNIDTSLKHSVKNISIPTLSSNVICNNASCSSLFPSNRWGYSVNSGSESNTYKPLVGINSAPQKILSRAWGEHGVSGSADISFGVKTDISKASGSYNGAVVISVVTGTSGSNIDPPVNPSTPNEDTNIAEYSPTTGNTTYTYITNNTSTTQVSEGDNREVYNGYTPPQGVSENTYFNINNISMLTTILAVVSSTAAGIGIILFIMAKREKNKDTDNANKQ